MSVEILGWLQAQVLLSTLLVNLVKASTACLGNLKAKTLLFILKLHHKKNTYLFDVVVYYIPWLLFIMIFPRFAFFLFFLPNTPIKKRKEKYYDLFFSTIFTMFCYIFFFFLLRRPKKTNLKFSWSEYQEKLREASRWEE